LITSSTLLANKPKNEKNNKKIINNNLRIISAASLALMRTWSLLYLTTKDIVIIDWSPEEALSHSKLKHVTHSSHNNIYSPRPTQLIKTHTPTHKQTIKHKPSPIV